MGCVVSCCYSFLYFTQQFYESYIRNNKPVQIFIGVVGGMLLMVILLAIFGAFRHPKCSTFTKDSSYYQVFTKSSDQTLCKLREGHPGDHCKSTIQKEVTIRGLFPLLYGKNTHLSHCFNNQPDYQFDLGKLSGIVPKLSSNWPAIGENDKDEHLWKLEWDLVGKCTDLKMVDYFQKTLDLNDKYPINKWLTVANIKPDNVITYTVDQFKTAMNKNGVANDQFALGCVTVPVKGTDGKAEMKEWLQDIKICVKYTNPLSLVQCDTVVPEHPGEHPCTDPFYYVEDYKTLPNTPTPSVAPPATTPTVPVTTPSKAPTTPVPTTTAKPPSS